MNDLKFALRSLPRHPFTNAVIVLTIALLIGAVSVIYASFQHAKARLAPFPEPEQVVKLWRVADVQKGGAAPNEYFPTQLLEDYSQTLTSFEALGAVHNHSIMTLTDVGEARSYGATPVSPGLLRVIGLPPIKGRLFDASDASRTDARPILISEQMWRGKFESDEQIIGREQTLDEKTHTVVGVLPEAMQSSELARGSDIWMLLRLDQPVKERTLVRVFGRLKPGVSREQAQAELDTVAPSIEANLAAAKEERSKPRPAFHGVQLASPGERLRRGGPSGADVVFAFIFGAILIGSVIGIACFNVTNLLLARVSARSREMAIRVSIGAGRWQIIRQNLAETVLLSAIGGLVGLLVSFWLLELFEQRHIDVRMDWRLYLIAAGSAIGLGVFVGLIPAFRSAKTDLSEALKDGGQSSGGRSRHRLRNFLVASQVAMALILCVLAGFMTRSYAALFSQDLNFDPDKVVSVNVSLRRDAYQTTEDKLAYMDRGLRAVQEIPGVESAAVTLGIGNLDVIMESKVSLHAVGSGEERVAETDILFASEDYRECYGRNLLRGRDLSSVPSLATEEALINESFAAAYFGDADPLGKRIKYDQENHWLTVVGVIKDRHPLTTSREIGPEILLSHRLSHWNKVYQSSLMFLATTKADANAMAEPIRGALLGIDAAQPVNSAVFISEFLERHARPARNSMFLLSSIAGLGLFIALMGVYGVVAFTVTERTREIGVRMAIGATRKDTMRLMLWQGARLISYGVIPGLLLGSLALTALKREGMGMELSPYDPLTYVATLLIVSLAGFLACLIPARKAANLNPMQALRCD